MMWKFIFVPRDNIYIWALILKQEGEFVTVYGEMVQTWSGYFVMPKYIEVVDGLVDNLSESTYH